MVPWVEYAGVKVLLGIHPGKALKGRVITEKIWVDDSPLFFSVVIPFFKTKESDEKS